MAKDDRVKLVDNPGKYQSFGLNRMIELAKGEVFLRADGHCYYKSDYVEQCVSELLKTGAKNVGGAQRYMAQNRVQAGVSLATKSFLGNGGAKYMQEDYEGYADTVFLGCFWAKDLRELGGFNTDNVTNQDSELNLRLTEKYGECVFISPKIKSWYYPRDTFFKLFKQYFRYGRGRFLTRILHPQSSPLRGMAPFLFILLFSFYLILDLFLSQKLYSLETAIFLLLILAIESFSLIITKSKLFKNEIWQSETSRVGIISNFITVFLSLILMQLGHFSGFLYQFIKNKILGQSGW